MQDVSKAPSRLKSESNRAGSDATSRGRVDVLELVGNHGRVTISHAGEDYILRITRNGKLILTK
ncbi:MAG: hemin uptake protein HemP [Gammaproteobacteria bacterium]|nr:hemin uptake protein HemP [Gammaproteobacteria bacterium]